MADKLVDARGLACPQPVVLTRNAISEGGADQIRVIVDNDVSAENVQRMARSQGWEPHTEQQSDGIHLILTPGDGSEPRTQATTSIADSRSDRRTKRCRIHRV